MKTKDLIKELQEEDPTGETEVRICGNGMVSCVMHLPGYYDGGYIYEEGNYLVVSREGSKVDIRASDVDDYIWDQQGDTSKILFKGYSDKDIERIRAEHDKTASDCKHHLKVLEQDMIIRVMTKLKEGYVIIQEPHKDKSSLWFPLYFSKKGKREELVQGERIAVLESGFFVPHEDGENHVWMIAI